MLHDIGTLVNESSILTLGYATILDPEGIGGGGNVKIQGGQLCRYILVELISEQSSGSSL